MASLPVNARPSDRVVGPLRQIGSWAAEPCVAFRLRHGPLAIRVRARYDAQLYRASEEDRMGFTATRGSIAGYAGALVLAAAALAVRWLLDPWLGDKAPLVAGLAHAVHQQDGHAGLPAAPER